VNKLLVLTGVVIVCLMGIGMPSRDSAGISRSSAFIPASANSDKIESPVVPAILLSEENTSDLWGSGLLVKVATTRRHHRRRVVVVRRRKFSHSAAIVGGSAAAGAGIGALAGGGKGAIIGGLAGGGAGLLYDRKTAKKKRVVVQ